MQTSFNNPSEELIQQSDLNQPYEVQVIKSTKSPKNTTIILLSIIILLLIAVAFLGFNYMKVVGQNNDKKTETTPTFETPMPSADVSNEEDVEQNQPAATESADSNSTGWTSYSNGNVNFEYPSSWTVIDKFPIPTGHKISLVNPQKNVGVWLTEEYPEIGYGGPEDAVETKDVEVKIGDKVFTAREDTLKSESLAVFLLDIENGYKVFAGTHGAIPGVTEDGDYNDYLAEKESILRILESLEFRKGLE